MTRIYSQATKVPVWLAHGDAVQTNTALDTLSWARQLIDILRTPGLVS